MPTAPPGWGFRIGVLDVGPATPVPADLAVLAARAAVTETLNRHYWAFDNHRFDIFAAGLAEDVVITYHMGPDKTVGPLHGRDTAINFFRDSLSRQTVQRRHIVANLAIDLDPGARNAVASAILLVDPLSAETPPRSNTSWVRAEMRPRGEVWEMWRIQLGIDQVGYTTAGGVSFQAAAERSD